VLPLVTVGPDAPLRDAIQKLVEYRKHRVWVVDGEGKAVGVVTPTDVLRMVIS
jgi:CBS domain-containing protein